MTTLNRLSDFGKGFQLKVLGSLLTDKNFLLSVRDTIQVDYFDIDSHKWIVQTLLSYFDKYHATISLEALKVELQKMDNEVLQVAVKEELKHSYQASKEDLQYVQEEFSKFCKNQELKRALLESADLLQVGDYDAIRVRIEHAIKAGLDKNIGHEYNKEVESRYREDYRPVIPSPWPTLNKEIQGGWGPGDLIIVFGSPGGGKSWMMVAAAVYAATLGYNVNYYTLELGEEYVGKRLDCNLTGYNIDEINLHRGEVEKAIQDLPGKLIIKEYAPKTASISTIKAHIQKCQDMGHRTDMVVIDYVDYLKPPSRKYSERKDEIDDVFIGSKALAKELKIPVLTPSQVNRAGAKDDIIEGDKAAGSYDKMMVADLAFSLSRKREDKVLGTGRIHIMKNRYGKDGITFNAKVDTNNGRILIEDEVDLDTLAAGQSASFQEISRNFFSLQ